MKSENSESVEENPSCGSAFDAVPEQTAGLVTCSQVAEANKHYLFVMYWLTRGSYGNLSCCSGRLPSVATDAAHVKKLSSNSFSLFSALCREGLQRKMWAELSLTDRLFVKTIWRPDSVQTDLHWFLLWRKACVRMHRWSIAAHFHMPFWVCPPSTASIIHCLHNFCFTRSFCGEHKFLNH